jgi:hypothetical protein
VNRLDESILIADTQDAGSGVEEPDCSASGINMCTRSYAARAGPPCGVHQWHLRLLTRMLGLVGLRNPSCSDLPRSGSGACSSGVYQPRMSSAAPGSLPLWLALPNTGSWPSGPGGMRAPRRRGLPSSSPWVNLWDSYTLDTTEVLSCVGWAGVGGQVRAR